jgi:SlyX protein
MSNSGMQHQFDTERRFTDLEIKASFQEDLLEELNQIVFRQQQQIELLLRDVLQLRQYPPVAGAGVSGSARDELPPHY